jgi:DNA replication protein DnaC
MIEKIHSLLEALRLRHSRQTIAEVLQNAQKTKPSYSSFLLELLHQEYQDKRNRAIAARIKNSGLTEYWTLETFPWELQKSLLKHKRAILELAELDFMDRGESAVFIGNSGVGKSGLASGLILKALYAGRTAQCIKAQDLFEELDASIADRSTKSFLKRLSRLDLLLIDDFGYVAPTHQALINNFFRLMDYRCNRKSSLITTNLGFREWTKFLGNGSVVSALLSRLLQKCHTFSIDGVNLRDPAFKLPSAPPKPPILNSSLKKTLP